jgi:hypothetical protein
LFITSKVLPRSARSLASTGSNSSRSACAVAFIAASASACEGLAGLVRIATRSKAGITSLINSTRLAQTSAKKKPQLRDEDLLDVDLEGMAIDGAIDNEGSHEPRGTQPGDEGRGFPMPVRHPDPQPAAARRPSVAPSHIRRRPGLVDEHEASRVEVELLVEPSLAPPQDVRPVLLGGMSSLFLRVIRRRAKKRHSVPYPAATPRARSKARNSSSVRSGVSSTSARINGP